MKAIAIANCSVILLLTITGVARNLDWEKPKMEKFCNVFW